MRLRPTERSRRSLVEGRWRPEGFGRPRAAVKAAADRLYELVQTAAALAEPKEA